MKRQLQSMVHKVLNVSSKETDAMEIHGSSKKVIFLKSSFPGLACPPNTCGSFGLSTSDSAKSDTCVASKMLHCQLNCNDKTKFGMSVDEIQLTVYVESCNLQSSGQMLRLSSLNMHDSAHFSATHDFLTGCAKHVKS